MIQQLIRLVRGDRNILSQIANLPTFGEIYMATNIRTCECCSIVHCNLLELKIFKHPLLEGTGLPTWFYVELAPPQQDVIDEVNKILTEL